MKYRWKKKYKSILAAAALIAALAAGCADSAQSPEATGQDNSGTGYLLTGPGSYDSADTAVITAIDKNEGTITFLNLTVSRKYTLSYDGTTTISDKFGQPLSLSQIEVGSIVDITFLKSKKRLTTMALSASAWSNEEISRYSINQTTHDITIGEDTFKFTKDTKIFSAGEEIELMDLNDTDVLSFYGIGTSVYSIVLEKGHGYLRLAGDEKFIGGWIEVGSSVIHPITEDMLLTVPEGAYQVQVSTKGGNGTKNVIINRGEEVVLDISDIEVEEPQFGQVVFALTPSMASLYVDGEKVDTSGAVTLEYGIHQLIAKATGYKTSTSYLKVAQESAVIEIVLEEEENDSDTEAGGDSGNNGETVSGGDAAVITSYYRIFVDAPQNAEVYFDGNYIGISPISFKKESGVHVITLRQSGYETRSYTVQIAEEDKDVTYSFADLVPN